MNENFEITENDLYDNFLQKYGDPRNTGWSPRRRLDFGFYQPSDYYETLVNKLVSEQTSWVDIGGGKALFPNNPSLSLSLSNRAKKLVVVDPSENVETNPFPHERVKSLIEDYEPDQKFDLATFRMVVEHIQQPEQAVMALNRILNPGGLVVIFTVNRWSPVTVVSNALPFWLHHPVKKIFWGGEEKDTFPTVYLMNTRQALNDLFSNQGFVEKFFMKLDDLSVFSSFKRLNYIELTVWKFLKKFKIQYPENCLLGVYEKK